MTALNGAVTEYKQREDGLWFREGHPEDGFHRIDSTVYPTFEAYYNKLAQDDVRDAAERQRKLDILQIAEVQDTIQRLNSATPEQIDNWLENNLTNLVQARVVIGTILKVLAAKL